MSVPFGKYALLRKLAQGGMAEVFLACQEGMEGFEKLVVVKRILPALSKETEFIQMFLNEARVAARLNHPSVVQIWDLGRIDELYFIAMEYVHGEDLRELIKVAAQHQRRLPHPLACRILADTLAGLHYAHTRTGSEGQPLGLVHRDVSPQNVIVTYEGTTKLVDFGIAKATRATSEQTQAGLFKGKFAYMSPEQSRGQPVDARSDVFAVGILLWEILTWRRLFKRPTEMATLVAVAEDQIPSPRSIDPTIPPELDRIVMRALARPLEERYGSALEMRADLEALIRAERWEADALALERFLRELFADKLEAQEADIRAAGVGSLDDFLLTVEEGTEISWMEDPDSGRKKPSSMELPATDDDPLPTAQALMPSVEPSATAPLPLAPPADLPSQATVISMPGPQIAPGTRPTFDNDTAPRTTIDPPRMSPRLRRLVVIGSAAIVVAAIGLTIAFWPAPSLPQTPPPAQPSTDVQPVAPGALKPATLIITTDAPAVIAVDGTPRPLGSAATVQVKAGVEHVVTVRRPGHSLHTVHVPILAQGEELPLHVRVR